MSRQWSFYEHAKLNGTGTTNMNGVYSAGAPGNFWIEPEDGRGNLIVTRMMVFYQDGRGWDVEHYAGFAAALTNGIDLFIQSKDGENEISLFGGIPVKTNAEWGRICYDIRHDAYGVGEEAASVRFTFARSGSPVVLEPGEKIIMRIQDNLSAITQHNAFFQGYYGDEVPSDYRKYL